MNFDLPKDYLDFKEEVTQFAHGLNTSDLIERDVQGKFAQHLWDQCGEFGLIGLSATKDFGGSVEEIDIFKSVLAMQGFGYGCRDNGLGIALNAHIWAVQMTISTFGSEKLKRKYLPKMASGEWIGAHALTEIDSGSDVFNMKTTAEKVDGGYILNGTKRLVTLAPISNVAVVFANVDLSLGKWGVTAFVADESMDGYMNQPVEHKMGLRTVPIGEIKFENCFVPDENVIGKEGAGFSISNHSLEFDRCCILAAKLGAMERQIEECVEFAKSHIRFGKKIASFQAVSHRIAEMRMRLETSKLLLYKTAWLKKNDRSAMLEGAMLKLHLGEAFVSSSMDAIRVHGGNGYLTAYEIERDLRDSIGGILYAGTSDIQKNIIAKFLGL
jgi:alkylation response protein AidB-like acyl-CoA dehydrogenase